MTPVIECYLHLLRIEWSMQTKNLQAIHDLVRQCKVGCPATEYPLTPEKLCHAMDLACVFYPKQVQCLQRSAAVTLLLRNHGLEAEMVIGAQVLPFKSHAWVEINNAVVNDKPYMSEIYQVLERC
jgi:hypothetical protein